MIEAFSPKTVGKRLVVRKASFRTKKDKFEELEEFWYNTVERILVRLLQKKNEFRDRIEVTKSQLAIATAGEGAHPTEQHLAAVVAEREREHYQAERKFTKDVRDLIKSIDFDDKADLIYLVRGGDEARPAWYYVLVDRSKKLGFLKALQTDMISVEDFGTVLESGYGERPSQEVTERIRREYDLDSDPD